MSTQEPEGLSAKEYLQAIVQKPLNIFKELTQWSDEDKIEFKTLLEGLEDKCSTTKEKGNKLEDIVEFIISKSYFFEVYRNVETGTNEIDEVIRITDQGRQAINMFKISRDVIGIDNDIILGECKNYKDNLGVTYIGKFYSLMVATDVSFGIIFTKEGLTGKEEEFHDGYGLIKVLRIIEKYRNKREFYILDFTKKDYDKLAEGKSLYDLIKAKKLALQTASTYDSFLKDNVHDNEAQIKDILKEI